MNTNILSILNIDANYAQEMNKKLNKLAATLHVYYSNLRGFHWHIEGKSFFTFHSELEKMYDAEAERIDEVAERILQLGGVPVRIYSEIEKLSEMKQSEVITCADKISENLLDYVATLIRIEREILGFATENGDDVTVGMMSEYIAGQEKLVWMLTAFLKK
ncbi:Dps family protein [Porphyromonas sp.]|uniref:Dps family protein n=1 Tax=Porphyromonas sp. TaxID=1924944 RepID=UPI0026DCCA6C|nr:DNA starvation/stationary phase protection protein [Porphyromonas sp.]MDO4770570.1 DNA starvation/stationary phase protection protein [Porphyromonas sp.]